MKSRIALGLCLLAFPFSLRASAQPPEEPAPEVEVLDTDEVVAENQRAEACVHIVAFAMEALKSQSPADYAAWPPELRGALPFWISSQPFRAWSPEVRQFARGKFQKLADDPTEQGKDAIAVRKWLGERAPFGDAELEIVLNVVPTVASDFSANRGDGRKFAKVAMGFVVSTRDERTAAMGELLRSLSPAQKKALLTNKMFLPMSSLSEKQRASLRAACPGGMMTWGNPPQPIDTFPDALLALDFQFAVHARRTVDGEEEFFEAQLARPFNIADKWPAKLEAAPPAPDAQ